MSDHESWWIGLATLAVALVLLREAPKGGYLRLELPSIFGGFVAATQGWRPKDRETAFFGLGLDGLLIVLYCRLLWLLLDGRLAAAPGSIPLRSLLQVARDWVWTVGAFDVLEDAGIFLLLRGKGGVSLERSTTGFALAKFAGLVVVMVLLLSAWFLSPAPG